MNTQKYVKIILYKVSLNHDVNLTTVEKYNNNINHRWRKRIF